MHEPPTPCQGIIRAAVDFYLVRDCGVVVMAGQALIMETSINGFGKVQGRTPLYEQRRSGWRRRTSSRTGKKANKKFMLDRIPSLSLRIETKIAKSKKQADAGMIVGERKNE